VADLLLKLDAVDVPVYCFGVRARPSLSAKGRATYVAAVQAAAADTIRMPIRAEDVQIEIFCASQVPDAMADVDNAAKPTLDALKGIAYVDDRQVCGLRVVRLDRTREIAVTGRAAWVRFLSSTTEPHCVWINVYSPSRLDELGGYDAVRMALGKGWHGLSGRLSAIARAAAGD
jgi:hypothetical protein